MVVYVNVVLCSMHRLGTVPQGCWHWLDWLMFHMSLILIVSFWCVLGSPMGESVCCVDISPVVVVHIGAL